MQVLYNYVSHGFYLHGVLLILMVRNINTQNIYGPIGIKYQG
ncbi:hypothetical protein Mpsy_2129 [Methanolobus psychrophilus R15]|nr:hypothetical protein Mpsy_2129 [Methanolobus psychrophilus R15]